MENKYITETYVTKKENPCGKGKNYPKITVGNNPLWRLKSKDEMEQFAKYPFNIAIGDTLIDDMMQTPGIATIYLDLCYSQCTSAESPIARKAYADWSYSTQNYTSASVQYQASDLMMVREGLINGPVMMIVEAKRALALINKSNPMNKYVRKHLVEACGFDYDDLYKNKAQFEGELNVKIRNFNDTFKIPNTSNLLKIRQNYFGRVFSDGMGSRTQYYVFVPESYALLDETSLPTGTALMRLDRGTTTLEGNTKVNTLRKYTYESFFEVYNFLESKFLENQDVNKMMADTLATYKGALLQIPEYKDFEMAIEYDPVILTQIHNIDILGRKEFMTDTSSPDYVGGATVSWEVNSRLASTVFGEKPSSLELAVSKRIIMCQDSNGIALSDNIINFSRVDGLKKSGFNFAYRRSCLLDIPSERPTVEDITDALSFRIGRKQIGVNDDVAFISELYCSTDIVTRIVIQTYTNNSEMKHIFLTSENINLNGKDNTLLLPFIGLLSKFDYAPYIYPGVSETSADLELCKVVGDIYNPTLIGRREVCSFFDRSWYTIMDTAVNTDSATN